MTKYAKSNTKKEFLDYLNKNRVGDEIIAKFNELPEIIKLRDNNFKLQIIRTFVNVSTTEHNFEMNYYSEHLVEYLLSPKVFGDIGTSINFLLCELNKKKIIK